MHAISTHDLRKEFGKKVAVAGLTLTVEQGEVFGFLGPNGAGKTTSIKMLLDLTHRTSGSAELLGKPIGNRMTRAQIGYLPEHFRFYPWLKAGEFLDLHGKLYGLSSAERQRRIPQLLTKVGLGDRAETALKAFSKGMTQRIGLAQALMNDPKLVILDEPTSGLDPIGRKLVRDIIGDLRADGTTVFVNSHLLSEIEKTCDRVAFIREGRVIEIHDMDDMSDGVRLWMRVQEVTAELVTYLGDVGEDVSAERQHVELTIRDESTIPQIVNWLTANGHSLYELKPQSISLEDRFIRVVQGDEMRPLAELAT